MAPLLEIDGVSFRYRGARHRSIADVSLTVEKGEVIVLAGESGCGKTTLTRCINGLAPRLFEGELEGVIRLDGRDLQALAIDDIGRSVASVFQDPRSQFFTTRSTSEVAFGCENFGMPEALMHQRVDEAFERLDIENLRDRSVFHLSNGERQKVALAAAYALRPRVYVLDEPSSNLDPDATRHLGKILQRIKDEGATVIVSEHRLYYLADILDRLVYMREGEVVEIHDRASLGRLSAADMTRRGLRQLDLARTAVEVEQSQPADVGFFQARSLTMSFGTNEVLRGVTCQATRGEIIGIIGRNGGGKTTLARISAGLAEPTTGRVRLAFHVAAAQERLRRSFLVLQDADYQLYAESVIEEMLIGGDDSAVERRRAMAILERLGLAELADRHPQSLSGGQKQRLTLAAAAIRDTDVVFLDEPTSGLDATSLRRVGEEVRLLAERPRLVFVISHDYELLVTACARVLRLDDGRVAGDYQVDGLSAARLRQDLHPPSPRDPWARRRRIREDDIVVYKR